MKKITTLFCLLIGSTTFANPNVYDLKIELSMNGKPVFSPHVLTKEGEVASITQVSNDKKIFMDVIAVEKAANNKPAILMNFVVGTLSPSGKKTILAHPRIVTLENEKANVTVKNEKNNANLSLSVVANRKLM